MFVCFRFRAICWILDIKLLEYLRFEEFSCDFAFRGLDGPTSLLIDADGAGAAEHRCSVVGRMVYGAGDGLKFQAERDT